jgi:DnaJ-class molecular chaperone
MVAAEKSAMRKAAKESVCPECKGTGIVTYWSEITFFEDRRVCRRCEAGDRVETGIRELVRKAQTAKPHRAF